MKKRKTLYFYLSSAKFYTILIVLAIEYLHKNNIIYRDLKPENVLIDSKGYIKLTDFGLSKDNIIDPHSASSFCGTPEYLAPEVFQNQGYGKPIDWWCLGCLLYEMVTGIPPFFSRERNQLKSKILNTEPQYPSFLSKEVVDLIKKLLIKDPSQRLGSSLNETDEIKKHPFFSGINWDEYLQKRVKPPFIPRLNGKADTKFFDTKYTATNPSDTPTDSDVNDNGAFSGFSYEMPKPIEKKRKVQKK